MAVGELAKPELGVGRTGSIPAADCALTCDRNYVPDGAGGCRLLDDGSPCVLEDGSPGFMHGRRCLPEGGPCGESHATGSQRIVAAPDGRSGSCVWVCKRPPPPNGAYRPDRRCELACAEGFRVHAGACVPVCVGSGPGGVGRWVERGPACALECPPATHVPSEDGRACWPRCPPHDPNGVGSYVRNRDGSCRLQCPSQPPPNGAWRVSGEGTAAACATDCVRGYRLHGGGVAGVGGSCVPACAGKGPGNAGDWVENGPACRLQCPATHELAADGRSCLPKCPPTDPSGRGAFSRDAAGRCVLACPSQPPPNGAWRVSGEGAAAACATVCTGGKVAWKHFCLDPCPASPANGTIARNDGGTCVLSCNQGRCRARGLRGRFLFMRGGRGGGLGGRRFTGGREPGGRGPAGVDRRGWTGGVGPAGSDGLGRGLGLTSCRVMRAASSQLPRVAWGVGVDRRGIGGSLLGSAGRRGPLGVPRGVRRGLWGGRWRYPDMVQ